MRFAPLAFLLAAASSGFLVSAKQQEECPPKPQPIVNIKFTDKDASLFHNYELHGSARIEEPAPEPVARALRIDQVYSYALLKDLDISPQVLPTMTFAMGVYIESIRPMHPDGAIDVPETRAHGWVMGHDNGGYDRAIFLHDERYNGMGMAAGSEYPANVRWTPPKQKKWMQIVAIWRQGGECEMYHDRSKVQFSQKVIGNNNRGLPNLSIGSLEAPIYGRLNDNDVWIKDVQVWDWDLSIEELEALECDFQNNLDPQIDCGDDGPLVESCTDCPEGTGAAGCKGDCVWDKESPICKEEEEDGNKVDCGDHSAPECSQCDATPDDTSGCAGECKWDIASETCVDENYVPPPPPVVDCGDHEASSCGKCPYDEGTCLSDGDNPLPYGIYDIRTTHMTKTQSVAGRGLAAWPKPEGKYIKWAVAHSGDIPNTALWELKPGNTTGTYRIEVKQDTRHPEGWALSAYRNSKTYTYNSRSTKVAVRDGYFDTTDWKIIPGNKTGTWKILTTDFPVVKQPEDWELTTWGNRGYMDYRNSQSGWLHVVDPDYRETGHGMDWTLELKTCTEETTPASGCAGECQWESDSEECIPAPPPVVDCGDHDAPDCSQCEATSEDTSGCAGECEWDLTSDSCTENSVDCGNHEATMCGKCPYGEGECLSEGDNPLPYGKYEIRTAHSGRGLGVWRTGNVIHGSTMSWLTAITNEDYVSMWELKPGFTPGTYIIQSVKNSKHPQGWSLNALRTSSVWIRNTYQSKVAAIDPRNPPYTDWKIVPGYRPGTWKILTAEDSDFKQPGGWGLTEVYRSPGTTWVDAHATKHADWTFELKECTEETTPASGCDGECHWDSDSDQCTHNTVDCGDHEALSCDQCPIGDGASGCAGDCMWSPDLGGCVEDNDNDISCGDHDAPDCSQCEATSEDTSGCAGDCKWDLTSETCTEDSVDCGDHDAPTCDKCPYGEGICLSDGDNPLPYGKYEIRTTYQSQTNAPAGRGLYAWRRSGWTNGNYMTYIATAEEAWATQLWELKPGKTPGTYRIETTKSPHHVEGWILSAGRTSSSYYWNSESTKAGVFSPAERPSDWTIIPGSKPGTWRMVTTDEFMNIKQPAGWYLTAYGDKVTYTRRNSESNWVNVVTNATRYRDYVMDWTFELKECTEETTPASGCDGECHWDTDSDQCIHNTVDCGDHEAFYCDQCPIGDGASGCAGDCMWSPDLGGCVEDNDNDISCGDHDVPDCSQCEASPDDTSGCAGDCKWDLSSESCIENVVDCGDHEASSCGKCPYDEGTCLSDGDNPLPYGIYDIRTTHMTKTKSVAGRGLSAFAQKQGSYIRWATAFDDPYTALWELKPGNTTGTYRIEVKQDSRHIEGWALGAWRTNTKYTYNSRSTKVAAFDAYYNAMDWKIIPGNKTGTWKILTTDNIYKQPKDWELTSWGSKGYMDYRSPQSGWLHVVEPGYGGGGFGMDWTLELKTCTEETTPASGCAGECQWESDSEECIPAPPPVVDCGDHDAPDCSQCEATSEDTSGCAGECEWDLTSDSCTENSVDCGNHEATICGKCPYGEGECLSDGDNPLPYGKYEIRTAHSGRGLGVWRTGNVIHGSNTSWLTAVSNEDYVSMWELKPGFTPGTYIIQSVKNSLHPQGWSLNAMHHHSTYIRSTYQSKVAALGPSVAPCTNWKIVPGYRPGTWKILTTECTDFKQPGGWGLTEALRGPGTSWVDAHATKHADWTFELKECTEETTPASGCDGECHWDTDSNQCTHNTVDCGDHEALSCDQCPIGDGASGCAGDCMWSPDLGGCVEDNDNDISCGDHDAPDCSQCEATSEDTSGCAGDCKWDLTSETCTEDSVDCGDHDAPTCDQCPYGECLSDGDNPLPYGKYEIRTTYQSQTNSPAGRGLFVWRRSGWNKDSGTTYIAAVDESWDTQLWELKPGKTAGTYRIETTQSPQHTEGWVLGAYRTHNTLTWNSESTKALILSPGLNRPYPDWKIIPGSKPGTWRMVTTDEFMSAKQPAGWYLTAWGDKIAYTRRDSESNWVNVITNATRYRDYVMDWTFELKECGQNTTSASGCAGECQWDPLNDQCVPDDKIPDIDCGDHHANSCLECDATNTTTFQCSEDCKWFEKVDECHDHEYIPPVDCGLGKFSDEGCSQCPTDAGSPSGCHGECMWDPDSSTCELEPEGGVNCGDHRAEKCSECTGHLDPTGGQCEGDCKFFTYKSQTTCQPENYNPFDCGNGRKVDDCEKCTRPNNPSGCMGRCGWNKYTNKCELLPNGNAFTCGNNHQASSCSKCGGAQQGNLILPGGRHYYSVYTGVPAVFRVENGPLDGEGRYDVRFRSRYRGGCKNCFPVGTTSVKIYTRPAGHRQGWIRSHANNNPRYKKYCSTAVTKYPAELLSRGYNAQGNFDGIDRWVPGYVVIYDTGHWSMFTSDNRWPQLDYETANQGQINQYC